MKKYAVLPLSLLCALLFAVPGYGEPNSEDVSVIVNARKNGKSEIRDSRGSLKYKIDKDGTVRDSRSSVIYKTR